MFDLGTGWGAGITLGGFVLGAGLLVHTLIGWWPGVKPLRKNPTKHAASVLPVAAGYAFGTLLAMCAGGLVGWMLDLSMWGASWAGDAGLVWGVGGRGGDVVASRGPRQLLTNGGHAFVLLAVFVFAAACRKSESVRGPLIKSAWAGVLLGLVPGVLGTLAVPLATAANVSMAWLTTTTLT